MITGNNIDGDHGGIGKPGLFGVAMNLVLAEGFWGDGKLFGAGQQFGHDPSIPGDSIWYRSAIITAATGPGIFLKNVGLGSIGISLAGSGNDWISQGLRLGATPNQAAYGRLGYNDNR